MIWNAHHRLVLAPCSVLSFIYSRAEFLSRTPTDIRSRQSSRVGAVLGTGGCWAALLAAPTRCQQHPHTPVVTSPNVSRHCKCSLGNKINALNPPVLCTRALMTKMRRHPAWRSQWPHYSQREEDYSALVQVIGVWGCGGVYILNKLCLLGHTVRYAGFRDPKTGFQSFNLSSTIAETTWDLSMGEHISFNLHMLQFPCLKITGAQNRTFIRGLSKAFNKNWKAQRLRQGKNSINELSKCSLLF